MSMPRLSLDFLQTFLPFAALVTIRLGTAFAWMPAPFGSLAPVQIRAAIALACGVALSLALTPPVGIAAGEVVNLVKLAIGEALVGTVIGLSVRVVLASAYAAGSLIGMSIGLGFAATVDPELGESTLPTSLLLEAFMVLLFLAMGGHHVVLAALAASFKSLPPGRSFTVLQNASTWRIGADLMGQSLRIASPVVATMFIVNLGTALTARTAPRVQLFSLTFAVAIAAGLLTLFVAAPSVAAAVSAQVEHLAEALHAVMVGS